MTRPVTEALTARARPLVRWWRAKAYASRYRRRLEEHRRAIPRQIESADRIDPGASVDALWQRIDDALPAGIGRSERWLGRPPLSTAFARYWTQYGRVYDGIGREKALEHALTFELLDFRRIRRYCDVAAATSPISYPLADDWSDVEAWRQDLLFETDLSKRVVGGFAQSMEGIETGFFDALTLHCSLEHFEGTSDVKLVTEVDRVLSNQGACLILPLYVATTHRVYFDPTNVSSRAIRGYDDEGDLFAVYGYHQDHGRFHSPETLASRLLHNVPSTLNATLLRFHDHESLGPDIYLRFGLMLHRPDSVFRDRNE